MYINYVISKATLIFKNKMYFNDITEQQKLSNVNKGQGTISIKERPPIFVLIKGDEP